VLTHFVRQSALDTLYAHFIISPGSSSDVDTALMDQAVAALQELVSRTTKHSKNNMLVQFASSRLTNTLVDDATKYFTQAIASLQLGVAVTQFDVKLRIDNNVQLLLRYVYLMHFHYQAPTLATQMMQLISERTERPLTDDSSRYQTT
jgi:hypothetical protein